MVSQWPVDWGRIWSFDVPVLEIVLRGTVMYLGLYLLLRVVLKRQVGGLGTSDTLLIVLLADAAQNGMAGAYASIPSGLVLVTTIIFWNYALDWLSFQVPAMDRLLRPAPLPLIRDGVLLRRNMRHELISYDEIMAHLREQGIADVRTVGLAVMESDGRISVIDAGKTGLDEEE